MILDYHTLDLPPSIPTTRMDNQEQLQLVGSTVDSGQETQLASLGSRLAPSACCKNKGVWSFILGHICATRGTARLGGGGGGGGVIHIVTCPRD